MLMGDVCTRHCGFCAVAQGVGKPLDPDEPQHVAEAVKALGVAHAVVTSVNRDELPDGGAAHFAATIREIRALAPGVTVEVLIPDFLGSEAALETVLSARPEVLNHNTETVQRLYRRVRPDAVYARSLELLRRAAKRKDEEKISMKVKSGVMVGLGETREELRATLGDLRANGVEVVTVGQYLQPHARRLPIERYYTPEEFEEIRREGEEMGFAESRIRPARQVQLPREKGSGLSAPLTRGGGIPLSPDPFGHSPSFPIASTGQESIASWHWASSSGVAACLWTYE